MELRCPYCGCILKKTNFGNYFCSNHGIVYENSENKDEAGERDYIG